MEVWATLIAAPLLTDHKTRIFGHGDNPINFVSARDVAAFIELALVDPALHGQAINVGGPDNLSVNQFVHRFEELTGARGNEQHVPLAMLRAMSVLMRPFKASLARQARAAVTMDTTDMAFDDGETARRYPSIRPTSFDGGGAYVITRERPEPACFRRARKHQKGRGVRRTPRPFRVRCVEVWP